MTFRAIKISALDILNSVVAALRDGVMPLYNLYIVSQLGLSPVHVGWLMTASSVASFLSQTPVGFLYDRARSAREPLAAGLVGLAGASALMYYAPGQPLSYLIGAQILYGIANAILSQGIPAITVSETPVRRLGNRIARNEIFAKFGNLTALSFATYLTARYSLRLVFIVVPLLALPAVYLILRRSEEKPRVKIAPVSGLRISPDVGILLAITALIYFANSSALVMFEQVFSAARANAGATYVAWGAGTNQIVVTLAILLLAGVTTRRGLLFVMAGTFALIIARLLVMSSGATPVTLLSSQAIDGLIAGVVFTVPMRLLAALERTYFNVVAGFLGAAASLGATASVFLSGYALSLIQYPGAIRVYVVPAALGLLCTLIYAIRVGDVRPPIISRRRESEPTQNPAAKQLRQLP